MSKNKILTLYKSLITESKKIPSYNFRNYALRKIRDSFQENKNISDATLINSKVQEAEKNLDLIKRQAIIGQMYSTDKLVIEKIVKPK